MGRSPTATSSLKATKLVMMGREDIVWKEDLTIGVLCWGWGILSLSDRSRLLSLYRLGSVGVSEADATRGVAPVIAGGTLARCLSPLLERGGGLTSGLGGCECSRGRRRYVRLDDAFRLGSCWGGDRNRGLRPPKPGLRLMGLHWRARSATRRRPGTRGRRRGRPRRRAWRRR